MKQLFHFFQNYLLIIYLHAPKFLHQKKTERHLPIHFLQRTHNSASSHNIPSSNISPPCYRVGTYLVLSCTEAALCFGVPLLHFLISLPVLLLFLCVCFLLMFFFFQVDETQFTKHSTYLRTTGATDWHNVIFSFTSYFLCNVFTKGRKRKKKITLLILKQTPWTSKITE